MQSLGVLNTASLARAANCTLTAWEPWFSLLVKSAESHLPPECVAKQPFCKPFWDSVPFVCNLHLYDVGNPLAWQHLACKSVHSVDAPHDIVSVVPVLDTSWKNLSNSLSLPIVEELEEACHQPKPQKLSRPFLGPSFTKCVGTSCWLTC